ncbi:MAG: divergent polysaccharide deacetylase family protein [Acidobacteriota bacterium]|nr:divergent polysaccharide deacetylase family protein [Acidobacteriota bacterium]
MKNPSPDRRPDVPAKPRRIAVWLIAAAALSAAALDVLQGRRGEPSYFFSRAPVVEEAPRESPISLPQDVPAEKPEKKPESPVVAVKKAPAPRPGRVALVVDDMGHDLSALDVLIGLEERLTVAVLPDSRYAVQTAEIARKNGIEIILHLPLEPLNNQESGDGTEGIIRSDMSRMTIRRMMEDYLTRVPHIRGVNNHMGSRGTADNALMRLVLEPLKERNLFFLDSMTSPRSIAAATAREMGIPAATRSVFLDDGGDPLSVRDRLNELFRQARTHGIAVGICHPYPQTLEVLKERFRGLGELGLEAVFVSDIVSR